MIKFITGRSGSGKTYYCYDCIKQLVESKLANGKTAETKNNILLITPEQYNFTAEKHLLDILGEDKIIYVENSSFTQMYSEMIRKNGGGKTELSQGARVAIMKKAVKNKSESMQLFKKKTPHTSFIKSMLNLYDEVKACGIELNKINNTAQEFNDNNLHLKLSDIYLVFSEYEKLTDGPYLDSACKLEKLYKMLSDCMPDKDILTGRDVFIDGFNSFAENEYKIINQIFQKAHSVTITLGLDVSLLDEKYSLFSHVNAVYSKLKTLAMKSDGGYIEKNLDTNRRTAKDDLIFCEKNLFSSKKCTYDATPENIEIYSSKDIVDECDYVCLKISNLLRHSVNAKDIAVICRNKDKYLGTMLSTFKKYNIPYFDDERQAVDTQPLTVFIRYLMKSIYFRSDDILSLLKTGLTDLSIQNISLLENYIYVWNINGENKWSNQFEASPYGFKEKMGEKDKSELEIIENCRKYIVEKLKKFKESVQAENADDIGRAIYDALIDFHVDKNLISIADSLIRLHMNSLAKEQGRIWDLVMYSINQLADIEKNEKISMNEYADLLNIIISNEDLGVIPQGLDNVIFATADRVRLSSIKYVFILGANEGEFPLTYVNSGLLTENDRKKLSDKDMKLYSSTDVINMQEKYFAYMAASVASDKLTVCYQGECKNAAPSTLIYSLKEIFPKIHVDKHSYLSNLDLIESRQSAFELLSEHLDNQDEFYESLKQYFINDDNYVSIQKIAANEDFHIKNKETSVELFDKDMYLSASRVEDYFNCPFRYFCKFGLHAQPLIKAEMNSMETGTIIHYVLENFLSNFGNETLQGLSEQDIKKGVDVLLNRYLLNKMGDTKELNSRFKYKLLRLSKMLYRVVMCLKDEFAQSNFKSVGFETEIDNHGDIKPKLIQLDDGGSVSLTGIVDRIDILEKDNDRYVRIVDYKSGTKEFELSDILYGLNLQMFVYLFTICADKTCEYSAIPAGVLYMHAARSVYSVDSADVNESISKREKKEFKMQGLLLYDDEHQILKDMEANLEERFIPVKVKNGDIVGSIASLGELGQISRKIDKLIKEMGENLHSGKIEQHPINGKNHDKTCEFCDYSEVCAFTKSVKVKEKKEYSREEVFDKIGEKGNSN